LPLARPHGRPPNELPFHLKRARDSPSTYSSRRPGRQVPTTIDQVVLFTIATDDTMVTVPPLLGW
jgi:hypothetical protein